MFTQNFNRIMDCLGLNNSRMAAYCGLSRTYIAKFRTGTRIPSLSSSAFEKLIRGFCLYASETNQNDQLLNIIQTDLDFAPTEDMDALLRAFLGKDLKDDAAERKAAVYSNNVSVFSERLDACMNLSGLSNVRLSKMMNVDASLISRYRSGSRNPQSNSHLTQSMVSILYQRICAVNKKKELASLAEIQEEILDEQAFESWLFSSVAQNTEMIGLVNQMVNTITLTSKHKVTSAEHSKILDDLRSINTEQSTYIGMEGLKQAVKRFLYTCITEETGDIWLYSEQDLSWLVFAPDFYDAFPYLVSECIRKQIKIHIIHNIHDNSKDLIRLISGWIPLYVSGIMDSFYCTNSNSGMFNHTIFLFSGKACIESFHVKGLDSSGLYHYLTEPAQLDIIEDSFRKIVALSEPLIRVSYDTGNEVEEGKYIILPDMIFVSTTVDNETKLVGHHLDHNPFGNVRIIVEDRFVVLTRLTEEPVTFTMTHPSLCRAFQLYVQSLIE